MDTLRIPQLVFSTRAAHPESGTEFNRQVIAATPGLPDAILSAFSALGDATYTIAQQRQLEPVLTFSRLGATTWLFCRAMSLGRYRKSGHHMLVHGLILRRSDLEPLQFNPFLLVDDALRAETGFSFRETHPGDMRDLPPIEMNARALRGQAPEWNRRRFDLRREEQADLDPSFPQLFDQVLKKRTIALVDDDPPDPRRMEWCLLHFHPEDRSELSFHTWYVYGRRLDFRLLMVTPAELPRLRPLFQDLVIWPPAKPRPQDASTVAQLTLDLRRRSPEKFHNALARRRVTHLAEHPLPPISTEDAELCLGSEIGARLDATQQDRLDKLVRRSGNLLVFHLFRLADHFWPKGMLTFREALDHLVSSGGWTIESHLVEEALEFLEPKDWRARWILLALLLSDLRDQDTDLVSLWRRIVPARDFEEFLSFFANEKELEVAAPGLGQIVLEDARQSLVDHQADLEPTVAYWPTFLNWPTRLQWLARHKQSPVAEAVQFEALVDEALNSALPQDIAGQWYLKLADFGRGVGLPAFAYRLLLQKWALLGEDVASHRQRLTEILREILELDASHDEVLRRPFGNSRSAIHLWTALGDWMRDHEDAEVSWSRWLRMMDSQGHILTAERGTDCGRFLARLALSANARNVAEAAESLLLRLDPTAPKPPFALDTLNAAVSETEILVRDSPALRPHLGAAWYGLIEARLGYGEGTLDLAKLDPKLLHLLQRSMIRYEKTIDDSAPVDRPHALDWMKYLQSALGKLLRKLQDERRLDQVIAHDSHWWCFLFDELLRYPPSSNLTDDDRYAACVELSWHRWARSRTGDSANVIRRLVAWSARTDPSSLGWHLTQMKRCVPTKFQNLAARNL